MRSQPRVLVVDSDENILAALRISLGNTGYRPILCTKAADALSKVSHLQVDIVIAEFHLDGSAESGSAFLIDIRRMVPDLPIIVIGSDLGTEVRSRLASLRIHSFLSKPFELRLLKRVIRSVLAPRRTPTREGRMVPYDRNQ